MRTRGFDHRAIAERGDPDAAEEFLPVVRIILSNLKPKLGGARHGISAKPLQADLNEFTFRFNRQFYPLIARNRSGDRGADLRQAKFQRMEAPYLPWLFTLNGQAWIYDCTRQ